MEQYEKKIGYCVIIIVLGLIFSFSTLSAQIVPYSWSFGTTSVNTYGAYPYTNYTSSLFPYYGNFYQGALSPSFGGFGYPSGTSNVPEYFRIIQFMQYYQYLSYAYQFYLIARSTPMFYQNDIVADYIGSSLYSYINQTSLSPQEAIISFIQQNLL